VHCDLCAVASKTFLGGSYVLSDSEVTNTINAVPVSRSSRKTAQVCQCLEIISRPNSVFYYFASTKFRISFLIRLST
jgi:hypothetical protein